MVLIDLAETDNALETFKAKTGGKGKVIVDFTAKWCPPCRKIKPVIKKLADDHAELTVIIVDVDDCVEVAESNNVTAMPTIHFYHDGKKITEIVGGDEAKIVATAKSLLEA